jgi:hypothetical protein
MSDFAIMLIASIAVKEIYFFSSEKVPRSTIISIYLTLF